MPFEIGGACRSAVMVSLLAVLPAGAAHAEPQPAPRDDSQAQPEQIDASRSMRRARELPPLRFGAWSVGKRGLMYRHSLTLGHRTVPVKVWAGRTHKRLSMGVLFEPKIPRKKLRFGAYGSPQSVGFEMRLRY